MRAQELCQKFLKNALEKRMEPRRLRTLSDLSSALLGSAHLSLSGLGRHIRSPAKVKNNIKRADRFLGNHHVYKETLGIYEGLGKNLMNHLKEAWIGVDWSGCCTDEYHVLRASLLYQGRSIPIYNEVHAQKYLETQEVHDKFLENLKRVLPENIQVVIVTDSGFKIPWFRKVNALGWDYVGRMRGGICYRLPELDKNWHYINNLFSQAKSRPSYLGRGHLGKSLKAPLTTDFFAYYAPLKGRKKKKQRRKPLYPAEEKRFSKSSREPWIIVSSLQGGEKTMNRCINCYKKRMQIEQNFRDDKSGRLGFGWEYCRSRNAQRLNLLCLISAIAYLILYFIGKMAEEKKQHYAYQANSIKSHRVLSYIFLGKQIILRGMDKFNYKDLNYAIKQFQLTYEDAIL